MLMGYVSFREGSSLVRVLHESTTSGTKHDLPNCHAAARLPRPVSRSRLWSWISQISERLEFDVVKQQFTRWWQLKHFFMFIPTWGDDPIWLNFSKGLKPPPRFVWSILFRILETSSIICIWTEIWPFPPNFRDFGSEILSSINFQGVKFQDVSIRRVFVGLLLLSGIIIFAPMSPVIVIASLPILMRL